MISMKDIASACNVSVATVSKALNNHKDVSEQTREYIKQKAKELGYYPNSSARALKIKKSYMIGVLFQDAARSGLTHDYFAHVLENIKVTAEAAGYDITFLNNSSIGKEKMSYLEHSLYRGLDGIVIACIDFNDMQVIELLRSGLPVVTIDYPFNERISITSDNVKGMSDLVKYVYSCGHRKIAYIYGEKSTVTRVRLASFYRTMEELGLPIREEYLIEAEYRNLALASDATTKLLALPDPPTCILYPDDHSSMGGINAIKDRGLRIPEDISIAGYDDIPIAGQMTPPLTTVHQDTEKMGKLAATELIDLIEKPKSTVIEQITVDGWLIKGGSVSIRNE